MRYPELTSALVAGSGSTLSPEQRIRRLEDVVSELCDAFDDLAWDGVVGCERLLPIKQFMVEVFGERELEERIQKGIAEESARAATGEGH